MNVPSKVEEEEVNIVISILTLYGRKSVPRYESESVEVSNLPINSSNVCESTSAGNVIVVEDSENNSLAYFHWLI